MNLVSRTVKGFCFAFSVKTEKMSFCFAESVLFYWPRRSCWHTFLSSSWALGLHVQTIFATMCVPFFCKNNITRIACTPFIYISRNGFWRFCVLCLVFCLLNDSKATFATLLTSRGAFSSHVSLGPMKELTLIFIVRWSVPPFRVSALTFSANLTNLATCSGTLVCWCLSLLPYFLE